MVFSDVQESALIFLFLNSENKTAYDCGCGMNTMNSLRRLGLIERVNENQLVWGGWEASTMEFKLTEEGRKLAKQLFENLTPEMKERFTKLSQSWESLNAL